MASDYPTLYGPTGSRIYPTPKEAPTKYKRRPKPSREIKRSISQYDHAELVSLSSVLSARVPALRAAIRDKNSWAFSNWLPVYMGEDDKWGEAAEQYLLNEVLPAAFFRELRQDFTWGLRTSGMGLDIHGDDFAIFTEDEAHNPKIHIVPSPLISNHSDTLGDIESISYNGSYHRHDGMSEVKDGPYKGAAIYNGMIRQDGLWVAVRVIGFESGKAIHRDIPISSATHYACEAEYFGQGRGVPRIAASILQWMNKEEIDDQFLKGLKLAAQRAVIHKLAPGKDALMSLGNALTPTVQTINSRDAAGNLTGTTEEETVWTEYSPDGNVQYIGADEDLAGISFENPHPNAEAFAVRVLMECLADLGWSWSLIDTSMVSRAPTRMETAKANNSMSERQISQEARSVRFFQYAIAKGMENGRLKRNRQGVDPFKWAVGFPKEMSVDQGNDAKADIERLKMGLTSERIIAAKEGYIHKHILRDLKKSTFARMKAAAEAIDFAKGLGHELTFDQAMSLFRQQYSSPMQQPQSQTEKPATATP